MACSERLPEKRHTCSHDNVVIRGSDGSISFWPRRLLPRGNNWHWLDTTVEIVTREEHEAEAAELKAENAAIRERLIKTEIKQNTLAVDIVTGKRMFEEDIKEDEQ